MNITNKHKIKALIISSTLSITLLVVGYFANNLPIFTGENLNQLYFTQKVCEWFGIHNEFVNDDAYFVNVSYDKDLVDAHMVDGEYFIKGNTRLGNTAITDREKLYKFLKILKDSGEYKYIILDIYFDPNITSKADSLLYPLISEMENIVTIRRDTIPLPTEYLTNKTALADYFATITATNFVRYRYSDINGTPYIPLKVYEDLHPDVEFKQHGVKWLPIYTCNGRLCHNSCFVTFDSQSFSSFNKISKTYSSKNYYNLGVDILENPIRTNQDEIDKYIKLRSKDKYVIIGDCVEYDQHDTYMGVRPGPYILYRALKTLDEEKHIVSVWRVIYWLIIFTTIFWMILYDKTITNLIPSFIRQKQFIRKITEYKLLMFVMSLIGYAMILGICSTLEYILTNNIYSIVVPLYTFMLTKLFHNYKKFQTL